MKSLKRKCLCILVFIVVPLFILGCSPKKESIPIIAEDINLNSGAVLKNENGNYKLYNLDNGNYIKNESDNTIVTYDKNSATYVYTEEEKYYLVHSGKKFELKHDNLSELKLSKGAEYISYFIEDNGLKLKVFDTNENKEVEIKSSVSISGTLYDWYDVNTIVYYGVSNEGVNGLFIYNLKENKEELLYRIKDGYLAYLEETEDNVVFLKLTLENSKELISIDKKTKDVNILSNNIEQLSDIIINKERIFFAGKMYNNKDSLYELKDNKIKRIVFDFPTVVKTEKGLSIDESGNILFIGCNSEDINEEQIYSYSKDGNISLISKNSIDYIFLDYKN